MCVCVCVYVFMCEHTMVCSSDVCVCTYMCVVTRCVHMCDLSVVKVGVMYQTSVSFCVHTCVCVCILVCLISCVHVCTHA